MVVLSDGFCEHCLSVLQTRIHNLLHEKCNNISDTDDNSTESSLRFCSANLSNTSLEFSKRKPSWGSMQTPESVYLGRLKGGSVNLSPASMNDKKSPSNHLGSVSSLNVRPTKISPVVDKGLSEEHRERFEFAQLERKKNFVHIERVNAKERNILQGLELHTRVFNADEQKKIVDCVYDLQRMGQNGQLRERTYSEPAKWMRGKGRVTIQFGCCYNYAVDKYGNPPGIIRDEEVDPLPPLFIQMIKKMVRWHVLPPTCIPNSCIVNIYEADDCIPPHIDHHDFLRPFCTVSFLTECNILFGSNLKIVGPGEFAGPSSIPLPVGSVLILNGNGADVAKHCIPAVPAKRISITFRKMDDSKLPYKFSTDPELQGIRPLVYNPLNKSPAHQNQHENKIITPRLAPERTDASFLVGKDDFPPLGGSTSSNRQRNKPVTKLTTPSLKI